MTQSMTGASRFADYVVAAKDEKLAPSFLFGFPSLFLRCWLSGLSHGTQLDLGLMLKFRSAYPPSCMHVLRTSGGD